MDVNKTLEEYGFFPSEGNPTFFHTQNKNFTLERQRTRWVMKHPASGETNIYWGKLTKHTLNKISIRIAELKSE